MTVYVPESGDMESFVSKQDPEKVAEYMKLVHDPVTEEEKRKIQENINLAREDVDLMADRVYEKVWGKKD